MTRIPRLALVGLLTAGAALTVGQALPATADETAAVSMYQSAEEGAATYAANCASCHQADGSGLAGAFPPLAGNPNAADTAYVESVIRQGLSGPIEVLGESYDSVMPAIGLTDPEIANVAAYVATLAGSDEPTTATTQAQAAPAAGDPDQGRDLFVGAAAFANGGAACASCHAAGTVDGLGGPGLGPDLTTAFDRLGGEAGLTGWLANPPSAVMTPLFAEKALTEAEIADVVAFLGEVRSDPAPAGFDLLLLAGAVGAGVLFAGLAIASRRLRRPYVERLRSRA